MKNPLAELTELLTANQKKERKIMTVVGILSGGQVRCEYNGATEIFSGFFSLGDSVIVIGSEIVGLAHKITNEYKV